nr:hypothetical protein [uncultured Caproiciproducens sp.]
MPDYRKMYYYLFNQITNSIQALTEAQQKTEEMYLNSDDVSIHISSDDENPH